MRTPRAYSTSNATRLLSAGAYLERRYRKRVIHELVKSDYRFVAPAYGYDVVTVLAHALVARHQARLHTAGVVIGLVLVLFIVGEGGINPGVGLLLMLVVVWACACLRRAVTLSALARLRATKPTDSYPPNRALTPALVNKITTEQVGNQNGTIYYGGYQPFVGAGRRLTDWSTAELLVPAQEDSAVKYLRQRTQAGQVERPYGYAQEPPSTIQFTVADITNYIGHGLWSRLQGEVQAGEGIERLTIERRRYSGAALARSNLSWAGGTAITPGAVPADQNWSGAGATEFQDDRERYDATREYLCVRIGSWDEELVISMFVGFDLRGNTLYSEFHPYVLPPVQASFHLVDRLPADLSPDMLARIAWHAGLTSAVDVLSWSLFLPLRAVWWFLSRRRDDGLSREEITDHSDLGLGRYAAAVVNKGALVSVRELAASSDFHHFFQEADEAKYIKIVERQLFQLKGEFLAQHNVDLGDHNRNQTNIIDASVDNYNGITVNNSEGFSIGGRGVSHQAGAGRRERNT